VNTLRYRLARFEELTGARLADPMCALELWWSLEYAALERAAGSGEWRR
jgi:DNA-binding PucR family transcriptional regulator